MSNPLIFPSLEIRQFRGLNQLRIEHLGRANLIVGVNNVGKTTVLEALRLYADPAAARVLLEIMGARNEVDPGPIWRDDASDMKPVPFESLFYGRRAIVGETSPIRIGPIGIEEKALSIRPIPWPDHVPPHHHRLALSFEGGGESYVMPVDQVRDMKKYLRMKEHSKPWPENEIRLSFVGPNGLSSFQTSMLWDKVALTSKEEDVLVALRIIAPEVERLVFKALDDSSPNRAPFVKIRVSDEPVPLRSMGDGVNRMFEIILALVNAKGGLLLVDEIENGIHYSVQPDLWRLIFRVAEDLPVQVFATSHSWDCIEAFQQAAQEDKEGEGVLIQLDRKQGQVRARQLDERELGIAVRGQIEIR